MRRICIDFSHVTRVSPFGSICKHIHTRRWCRIILAFTQRCFALLGSVSNGLSSWMSAQDLHYQQHLHLPPLSLPLLMMRCERRLPTRACCCCLACFFLASAFCFCFLILFLARCMFTCHFPVARCFLPARHVAYWLLAVFSSHSTLLCSWTWLSFDYINIHAATFTHTHAGMWGIYCRLKSPLCCARKSVRVCARLLLWDFFLRILLFPPNAT